MFKTIFVIAFLSFAAAFNAYAQDSDRIDRLEKDVQETKARLSKIEALLANPSNSQNPVTSGEGWKSLSNWRKLAAGMSPNDVRKILGEPQQVAGGISATWAYQNGAVMFNNNKVFRWIETGQ